MSLRISQLRLIAEVSNQWLKSCIPPVYHGRQVSTSASLHRKKKIDKSSETSDGVSSSLKNAVKSVAEALPGNKDRTESVLLQQLRKQAKVTKGQQDGEESKSGPQMSSLLSSMKVKKEQKEIKGDFPRTQGIMRTAPQDRRARLENVKLFGGPSLGIFKKKSKDTHPAIAESTQGRSLWDEVEAESLDRLAHFPPENACEEMIQMTKEGKLWTFPINNEAGMVEEQKVGFHEHVFLDHHIADFPHRGPIRHFMELVVTGLSKNPYLTVSQKLEHIDWFRRYFKEKQSVLEESLGADGVMKSVTDNQLQ